MPSQSTTDPEKWQLFSVCNQHRDEGWNETIIQLISRHTKERSNTDVDGWCMCFATYEKQPSPHIQSNFIMMQRTLFALLFHQHKIIVFVVIIIVRFFALFTKPSLTHTPTTNLIKHFHQHSSLASRRVHGFVLFKAVVNYWSWRYGSNPDIY
jgi:hypothetical protein